MPQRVVVIWTCSLCPEETDSAEKVTQYQLSGGGRTLAYDICSNCAASEPFATLLAAGLAEGPAGRTSKKPERVPCKYCDQTFTHQGMSLHQAKAHNVKSGTAALLEVRGKSGGHPCPECEFQSPNVQGLGAHRRAKHGIIGSKAKR